MLFSNSFIFTLRQDPKTADCKSHKLLLKGCFLHMVSSGIYTYLPLGLRVLRRISDIIRKNMNAAGGCEMVMSALQPIELWQKTGRDKDLNEVMFKFRDRKNRELCLGPTHEEEITDIAAKNLNSYKQLPFILYQIQTKFRDEPRPRFGLMRSAEFIMKDAYSFDAARCGLDANYQKMLVAYQDIFRECGLDYVMVEADSGVMGGDVSHEFMVPAAIGEDVLYKCAACGKHYRRAGKCARCRGVLKEERVVEVGHIFKLGEKYSQAQEAYFLDKDGKRRPVVMGCYGIGVSRLLPSIVETNCDEKGIIWPKNVSPYDLSLLALSQDNLPAALSLAQELRSRGLEVLVDDRACGAGVKFNDAYLIGNPYIAIMGKKFSNEGKLDVEVRKDGNKYSFGRGEFIEFIRREYDKYA